MNAKVFKPLAVFFWLVCIALVVMMWRFMPSFGAQVGLLILLGLIITSTLNGQVELPVLSAVFLGLAAVHYVQALFPDARLIGVVLTFVGVPALGLIGERIGPEEAYSEGHLLWGRWLLLGLITAEATSVFSLWPVSFINRALLTGIIFYFFWEMIKILETGTKKRVIGHFVFVGLAVILVIGIIVWVNFPHLLNF